MSNPRSLAFVYFLISISVAMVLRVMSVSPWLDTLNPDWIALALIYWTMAFPERFGVFTACFIGLLTDVLTGRLLGQYALIYALIAYFSVKEHRRLRQFPLLQQSLFVFYFLLMAKLVVFGMESLQAGNRLTLSFWYPLFTGVLAWPVVFWVLRYVRVVARIE